MDIDSLIIAKLTNKTVEEVETAKEKADTDFRNMIVEIRPEWPLYDSNGNKLPQSWENPLDESYAEVATSAILGEEVTKPQGLEEKVANIQISTKL